MEEFLWEYKWVIAFYLGIILFIFLNRKKFEFQAKVIALYRTKFGLKLMESIGTKHAELVKLIAYIGIGIGFAGMVLIMGFIIYGVYNLIFAPSAPAVLGLVLPGITVPGQAITVPLLEGVLALFVVVVIHEFSHGVVSRAHKVPVQSSGIVFFGPIIGAFVEPDEKKLKKQSDIVKYSIFAAGPWSNIIFWVLLQLFLVFTFVQPAGVGIDVLHPKGMTEYNGVVINEIVNGSPSEMAGLQPGLTYSAVNNISVKNSQEFSGLLNRARPNETITITDITGNDYIVQTGEHPNYVHLGSLGVGYFGMNGIKDSYKPKGDAILFNILTWIGKLLFWMQALSLGLGLANLLPLGPVDGGRMIQEALMRIFGDKKGILIWYRITMILFAVIIALVFLPILRAIF